ncbi:PdaC/SigV domain-containing protein [Saccharibacillus alkalitolerans]|uniref:DUF4163 domain-containing protein n=1 Tax=Saccharibacillus alkalitolerans TaxID=2705290 RepID=A0ABX0FC68_9BACL|nr:DUF4163 domain-containing protein [Saccharibacillus alkalitolerans]NGZ77148.1 DUF4163 domain-containing protein [Saccharibacillus alkalitolerans]
MKRATLTLPKMTKMMTAAVLTAGLLLPATAMLGTTGVQVAAAASSAQATKTVKATWNGKALGANAFQAAGDTYVPVKALAKAAGLSLTYDKTSGQYTLGTSPNTLTLSAYQNQVWISANGVGLQTEGRAKAGTMYVPLSVLSDFAGIDGSLNAASGTVTLKPAAAAGIKVTEKTLKSNLKNAVVDIRYPVLSGSAKGIDKINATLKKHAQSFLNGFGKDIKKYEEWNEGRDMHYEADANFMISYNRDGLFSVVTQDYAFYGGAHGGTLQTGYNFDLKTGKEVTLSQLLKANPNYRGAIDKKIAAEFKKQGSLLETDGFKTIGSDPNFYVKNGGFTIFFQQYEYTPYAAGIPSFDFTFASLLPKGTNPFAGL